MRTPVVVVNRGCGAAGCAVLLLPVLALIGLVAALGALVDAIVPGSSPWWVEVLVVVVAVNLFVRHLARRARRRMGIDRPRDRHSGRSDGPPGVIDV